GLALAWGLLGGEEDVGRRAPPERSARLVEVVPAVPRSHTVSVTAWGEVLPARRLDLRPRVSGRVMALGDGFEPGTVVSAGTPLLRLDPQDYRLALERARSALTRAKADLALEQGRQAVARREFELLGEDVEDAERGLILRQPQLQTAQAAVTSAEADLSDARLDLERTTIEAPFDALVLARDVSPGTEVSASSTLAELVGVDTWWVELQVPAGALRWIRFPDEGGAGSPVTLSYQGVWPEGTTRAGRVLRLRGDLADQGRLARVLVAVEDPLARGDEAAGRPRLLLGAFMQAEIAGRSLDGAVAMEPQWLHAGDTVWIMNDAGELEIRPVEVAYRDTRRVLVTGGIGRGERIVTSQLSAPVAGMPLRAAPADGGDRASGD
ncbi:efflux RND transporter periplasmic adaptor subunit, partial [Ectothiorhodospiraceae bacterium WFHF3C12]|nr:efflux RND transporter periplasmic adaptor subunit [Ectothiorhodospiraceae bacterium WFHF3C12]